MLRFTETAVVWDNKDNQVTQKVQAENDGKTKDELDFGRGEYYDTSSPKAFVDATYGKCIDLDGWFGSQCVDYMAAFMYQEYGRWLSTNGTGAAYGIWDAKASTRRSRAIS